MNSIKLSSTFKDCFTIERQEYRHIKPTLIIDGAPLHGSLSINLRELVKSACEEGEYFIFTWYEDYPDFKNDVPPDEGNIDFPVRVFHADSIIRWHLISPIDSSMVDIEEYCYENKLDCKGHIDKLYRDEFLFKKDIY